MLAAFGELEASWRVPIDRAVAALDATRAAQRSAAAREIAELIANALSLVVDRRVPEGEDPKLYRETLEQEYKAKLERFEAEHRRSVQRVYEHFELEASATVLTLLEQDLFSEGTWLTFGLRRRDLVTAGAASGAATGGVVDVALGGASILLGVAAGAAIGGVLGWFGAGKLADLKVVDRPLGGALAQFGPSRNVNFPFVLFGRARVHWGVVEKRTHAMRTPVELDAAEESLNPLTGEQRKALEGLFATLRKPSLGAARRIEATDALRDAVGRDLVGGRSAELVAPSSPQVKASVFAYQTGALIWFAWARATASVLCTSQ